MKRLIISSTDKITDNEIKIDINIYQVKENEQNAEIAASRRDSGQLAITDAQWEKFISDIRSYIVESHGVVFREQGSDYHTETYYIYFNPWDKNKNTIKNILIHLTLTRHRGDWSHRGESKYEYKKRNRFHAYEEDYNYTEKTGNHVLYESSSQLLIYVNQKEFRSIEDALAGFKHICQEIANDLSKGESPDTIKERYLSTQYKDYVPHEDTQVKLTEEEKQMAIDDYNEKQKIAEDYIEVPEDIDDETNDNNVNDK